MNHDRLEVEGPVEGWRQSYGVHEGRPIQASGQTGLGNGEVLEDSSGESVSMFFVGAGEKRLKPQSFNLIPVGSSERAHPILDNLRAGSNFRSLPALVENFKSVFPGGFRGETYHRSERDYKVKAHELILSSLGRESLAPLIQREDYSEIIDRARKVVNQTNLMFPNEKMALKDGTSSEAGKRSFGKALYDVLYGERPMSERFEAFAACLADVNAANWTTATYFLFLRFPDQHMFMKPQVTRKAADACAFELNYRSELNWLTYSKLLELSRYLLNALIELEPQDMIDIQSFIWSTERISQGEYHAG